MSSQQQQPDWVEIVDPQTSRPFYANIVSGSCSWERPAANIPIRPRSEDGEWWQLFDPNHNLPYYYNTKTTQTEWTQPNDGRPIISLIVLQKSARSSGFPFGAASSTPSAGSAIQVPKVAVVDAKDQNSTQPNATAANGPAGGLRVVESPTLSVSGKSLPPALLDDINKFKIEGFANKFFATHKRGIFRRKVPIQKMIHWSKDTIPGPLLLLRKELHKDAIKCYKLIQKIMGDKVKQKTNSEDIQALLQAGIFTGELRDEIYCQLCKQLTKNPRRDSIFAGWELMAVLVVTFPPSKNFEAYLNGFLRDSATELQQDAKLYQIVQHSIVKFERICKKGPRGKVPTIAEIDRAKEAAFNPSVFGEALPDIMAAQKDTLPDLKLPRIMTFLAESILQLNGCGTEGIFRVPGDADAVTELRLRLEKGVYDVSGITDASVPASLFKFWLRDLTDPIIPHDLYDYCIKNAEDPVKALAVVERLPEHNRDVLKYLCNFLQIVGEAKNQPVTRMSINNIAMVFAPNILRCPSDNLQVILEQTKFEQAFVRTLIQHMEVDVVGKLK